MIELTPEEKAAAARMGVSEEDYAACKPEARLTPEARAFAAFQVAERLGVSREHFVKHANIIKEGETDGL